MLSTRTAIWLSMALIASACGGGGSSTSSIGTDPTPVGCSGNCATASSFLTTDDVGSDHRASRIRSAGATEERDDRCSRSRRQRARGVSTRHCRQRAGGDAPRRSRWLDNQRRTRRHLVADRTRRRRSRRRSPARTCRRRATRSRHDRRRRSCRRTSIPANATSRRDRCSACSSRNCRAPTSAGDSTTSRPTSGPKRSPLGLSADPAAFRSTRTAPSSAASA